MSEREVGRISPNQLNFLGVMLCLILVVMIVVLIGVHRNRINEWSVDQLIKEEDESVNLNAESSSTPLPLSFPSLTEKGADLFFQISAKAPKMRIECHPPLTLQECYHYLERREWFPLARPKHPGAKRFIQWVHDKDVLHLYLDDGPANEDD